jgi:hypothetical protein
MAFDQVVICGDDGVIRIVDGWRCSRTALSTGVSISGAGTRAMLPASFVRF